MSHTHANVDGGKRSGENLGEGEVVAMDLGIPTGRSPCKSTKLGTLHLCAASFLTIRPQ